MRPGRGDEANRTDSERGRADAALPSPLSLSSERRIAADGYAYTYAEFVDFYGGATEWDAAPLERSSNHADGLIMSDIYQTPRSSRVKNAAANDSARTTRDTRGEAESPGDVEMQVNPMRRNADDEEEADSASDSTMSTSDESGAAESPGDVEMQVNPMRSSEAESVEEYQTTMTKQMETIAEGHETDSAEEVPAKAAEEEEEEPDENFWKKVHSATRWGKLEALQQITHPRHANIADPKNGNRVIHIAAQNGHLPVVEYLIGLGADVGAQNKTGQTAMHMAVEYNYYGIIQALIAAGADQSATNRAGHEAQTGIEGKKCIAFVAFVEASSAKELKESLQDLLDVVTSARRRRLVDKAMFAQTGLGHKKTLKAQWASDPLINESFVKIIGSMQEEIPGENDAANKSTSSGIEKGNAAAATPTVANNAAPGKRAASSAVDLTDGVEIEVLLPEGAKWVPRLLLLNERLNTLSAKPREAPVDAVREKEYVRTFPRNVIQMANVAYVQVGAEEVAATTEHAASVDDEALKTTLYGDPRSLYISAGKASMRVRAADEKTAKALADLLRSKMQVTVPPSDEPRVLDLDGGMDKGGSAIEAATARSNVDEKQDTERSVTVKKAIEPRVMAELQKCRNKAYLKARAFVAKVLGGPADVQLGRLVFSSPHESPAAMCERSKKNPLVRLLASKALAYELQYRALTANGDFERQDWLEAEIRDALAVLDVKAMNPRVFAELRHIRSKAYFKARAFIAKAWGERADNEIGRFVFPDSDETTFERLDEVPGTMCEKWKENPLVRLFAAKALAYELRYREEEGGEASKSMSEFSEWVGEEIRREKAVATRHILLVRRWEQGSEGDYSERRRQKRSSSAKKDESHVVYY